MGPAMALLAAAVLQQGSGLYPDMRGEWRQEIQTRAEKTYTLTPGGAAAFNRRMGALAEIVHAAPVFQPPLGIQPLFRGRWWAPGSCALNPARPCRNDPVQAQMEMVLYPIFEENGKPAWGGETNTSADIWVNALDGTFAFVSGYEVLGGPTYLPMPDGRLIRVQPRKTAEGPGYVVYDSLVVVVPKPGRPSYWIPVTREQYLRALIAHNERELKRVAAANSAAQDPYTKWVADREKRRQAIEGTYQRLKASSPASAEEYRRKALDMESKMEEGLRNSAAKLAPVGDPAQVYRDIIASLTTELQAMSPAERASQAWYLKTAANAEDLRSSLLAPAGEPARALVAVNPAYFDRSRPTTDWQIITMTLHWRAYRPDFLAVARLFDFISGTDWRRAATLME